MRPFRLDNNSGTQYLFYPQNRHFIVILSYLIKLNISPGLLFKWISNFTITIGRTANKSNAKNNNQFYLHYLVELHQRKTVLQNEHALYKKKMGYVRNILFPGAQQENEGGFTAFISHRPTSCNQLRTSSSCYATVITFSVMPVETFK